MRGERSQWCRTGSAVSTRPGGSGRRFYNTLVLLVQFSQTLCALSQARHMRCASTSALGHFWGNKEDERCLDGPFIPLGSHWLLWDNPVDSGSCLILHKPQFCSLCFLAWGETKSTFPGRKPSWRVSFFSIFIQNTSQQGCKLLSWIKDGGLLSALHYSTHRSAGLRSWLSICHVNALAEQPPYSLHYQYLSLPCDLFNPFSLSAVKAPCTSPFSPQGLSGSSWSSSSAKSLELR